MVDSGKNINAHKSLCHEGKICIIAYVLTIFFVCHPFVLREYDPGNSIAGILMQFSPIFYTMLLNMLMRYLLNGRLLMIGVRASFLGFAQGVSALIILLAPGVWLQFGVYASFLSFFHFSEFMSIAWSNPNTLSPDSFVLNPSIHYVFAAIASWVEFALEVLLLPEFKNIHYIWCLGILMCACGEIVRKTAIFTAATNFTHLVQYKKHDDHQLITHGIYGFVRHPSYCGWFWWSIGTQIILFNPICIVLYAIVSWQFFRDRIFMEEITLTNFFPYDYPDYRKKVPTGLPFIKGFEYEPEIREVNQDEIQS